MLKDLPVAARDASDLVHWPCRFSFCTLVSSTALYRQMTATMAAAGFRSDDCEYLYLDNTAGNVGDGYRGLNRMLFQARGEYVILCHQDLIAVDARPVLERCIAELNGLDPDWAVVGNAGFSATREKFIRITDRWGYDTSVGKLPGRVVSLDENFLLVRNDACLGFSHDLAGFHLYATDLVQQANMRGRSAYVVDFHLEHTGTGALDDTFVVAMEQFQEKYRRLMQRRKVRTPAASLSIASRRYETNYRIKRLVARLQGRSAGPLEALQHSINTLKWRVLDRLTSSGPDKYVLEGVKFVVPRDTAEGARRALKSGDYELPERDMIAQWLPRDLPVIELGGSFGIVSNKIRRHIAPQHALVVVEAITSLVDLCHRNATTGAGVGKVEVVNAALAYGEGATVRFRITPGVHMSHVASRDEAGLLIEVPRVSLADLRRDHKIPGPYSLVCDIEGAELAMIENDTVALRDCAVMVMEVHSGPILAAGRSMTHFLRLLSDLGFEVVDRKKSVIVAKNRHLIQP